MSDLIDRQAAIEAVSESLRNIFEEHDDVARKIINKVPSAEPERKKGKWEVTAWYIKCSECGECFMLIPQNFCPDCGADMREDNDK